MPSQVMNGQRTPSGDVPWRLHQVLFQPTAAELVMPVELKVLAWKGGGRNGVVIRGVGGPRSGVKHDGGTIRVGGRMSRGAEAEFAYSTAYDSRGWASVNHIVDERACSAMLKRGELDGVCAAIPVPTTCLLPERGHRRRPVEGANLRYPSEPMGAGRQAARM